MTSIWRAANPSKTSPNKGHLGSRYIRSLLQGPKKPIINGVKYITPLISGWKKNVKLNPGIFGHVFRGPITYNSIYNESVGNAHLVENSKWV